MALSVSGGAFQVDQPPLGTVWATKAGVAVKATVFPPAVREFTAVPSGTVIANNVVLLVYTDVGLEICVS